MFKLGGASSRTFKPNRRIPQGNKLYELKEHAERTLGSGDLQLAVKQPEGEDLNEWLAVNTVDFFNQINMLYGTIMEFCTPQDCPIMSAGPKYEYMWADAKSKKAIKCSAPEYMENLMNWVQEQLDDETIFPSRVGEPFIRKFPQLVSTIFKRLFRVYAHIYHSHFAQVLQLGSEAHLNTSFKHFIYFVHEFDLISKKELEPMADLIGTFIPARK
eukprot:TRINITY_DN3196_c0_g1_i1.p1 TRINITY_DN3196_c0_g1~~TRINITY_DN3196_c0_g1_i1.p1  ORF type:complete len:215 (+),score=29.48 TRINITY_DN3196_c0_g1_i1:96-740(+)